MSTITVEPAVELDIPPKGDNRPPWAEEKETPDDIKKRARKPPADGPCKGCGQNKPLNRLMLCYRCWVDKVNTERGWKPGQPHPATCRCDLDCKFDTNRDNN